MQTMIQYILNILASGLTDSSESKVENVNHIVVTHSKLISTLRLDARLLSGIVLIA